MILKISLLASAMFALYTIGSSDEPLKMQRSSWLIDGLASIVATKRNSQTNDEKAPTTAPAAEAPSITVAPAPVAPKPIQHRPLKQSLRIDLTKEPWNLFTHLPPTHQFFLAVLVKTRTSTAVFNYAARLLLRLKPKVRYMEETDPRYEFFDCPERILVAALMLSWKFLEDDPFANSYWSEITGIPLQELSYTEMELLKILDYRLWMSESGLQQLDPFVETRRRQLCKCYEEYFWNNPGFLMPNRRHEAPSSVCSDESDE